MTVLIALTHFERIKTQVVDTCGQCCVQTAFIVEPQLVKVESTPSKPRHPSNVPPRSTPLTINSTPTNSFDAPYSPASVASTQTETMAAKSAAVGSASWISAEKENALQLLQNEKEEVVFPAQHQLEWLNEHMGEIFSRSHMYVTESPMLTDRLT